MKTFLRSLLLLFAPVTCIARTSAQSGVKTWWPDPSTGLMWTGNAVGTGGTIVFPHSGPRATALDDHAHAVSLCKDLRLNDATDWRLPTYEELETVIKPRLQYKPVFPGESATPDYSAPVQPLEVEFAPIDHVPIWTDTPDDHGGFRMWRWPSPQRAQELLAPVVVLCVRPMGPDLLDLAKAAHPSAPISNVEELKATGNLVNARRNIDAGNYTAAVDDAKRALELDPKSQPAAITLGLAYSYGGQWDQAIATLPPNTDYIFGSISQDIAKRLQQQSLEDPKVNQAWPLVAKTDAAIRDQRYAEAASIANQIIQLEPRWPEGYHYLGLADGWLGKWKEAIAALKQSSKSLGYRYHTLEPSNLGWAKYGQKGSSKDPSFKPPAPY